VRHKIRFGTEFVKVAIGVWPSRERGFLLMAGARRFGEGFGLNIAVTKPYDPTQEKSMKYLGLASTLIIATSVMLVSGFANAQSSNSGKQTRTAAKAKCVQEGEARVPTVQTSGQVTMRKNAYADCMRQAGFRP
jgi:hypothetical protein